MADTDGTPSLKTLTIDNKTSKEVTLPEGELEVKSEAAAFPEGGFRAWATVAGACVLGVHAAPAASYSPLLSYLRFLVQFCGFG
jgi:hypothetical protein